MFDHSRYTFYENGPREKYFLDTRLRGPEAGLLTAEKVDDTSKDRRTSEHMVSREE